MFCDNVQFRRFLACFYLTILSAILCTGCAVSPLSGPTSARPIGAGVTKVQTGFSPLPYASIGYGVNAQTDLGITIEQNLKPLMSPWTKWSSKEKIFESYDYGFFGGVFTDFAASRGLYAGPVIGRDFDMIQIYSAFRYLYVDWNTSVYTPGELKDFTFSMISPHRSFHAIQGDVGLGFHLTPQFTVTVSGRLYQILQAEVVSESGRTSLAPGVGVQFTL